MACDNLLTMHISTQPPIRSGRTQGFTLIELMITVVVVAILAAIALPSFLDSVRKSRRADAFTAITAIQQAQERWRGSNAAYAAVVGVSALPPGLGLATTTSSGYYTLALSGTSETQYSVVATAVADRSQDADGVCKVLGARIRQGNLTFGSGAAGVDFDAANPDPGRCWAR